MNLSSLRLPSTTPSLVNTDIEALVPMTETKYLDNKPVLVFTEQSGSSGLNKEVHSSSLIGDRGNKNLKIVLVNRKERERLEKEIWEKMNQPKILMKKLTVILFLLTILSSANAEEINLPAKDEKVYATQDVRVYDLKVKLKPKIVESKAYWQGRESIDWEEAIQDFEFKAGTDNIKCVPQDNFLDIIFSTAEPAVFSRDMDVDLEEFPFLNLDGAFSREAAAKLIISLGVDYTGDGLIDGYLSLEEFGEHNLFELAKDKWQEVNEYENEFKLKRMIFSLLPVDGKDKESQIGILRLKDITLFNDSLILVGKEFNKGQLRFEEVNVKSEVIEVKRVINLICYFDAAAVADEEGESTGAKSAQDKKREPEEVRVFIPLEGIDWEGHPYFSFSYNLDDSGIQDIGLAVLVGEEGRVVNLEEGQYKKSEDKIEVNLRQINFEARNIASLIIRLKRSDDADCSLSEAKGWYRFRLSGLRLYEKFPYPLKSREENIRFLSLLSKVNPALLKIDKHSFYLNDFGNFNALEDLEREVLVKEIELAKGNHNYEKLENPMFDVEWVILEPETGNRKPETRKEPEITFKKINPTKYLVKVKGAEEPFWLVFSESFHKQWRLYKSQVTSHKSQEINEIVADYPKLKVKEARHLMKFTPEDIKFLFESPLEVPHHLVNGYANGWYIEPERLKLEQDFTLVLYFWPQSLFYLGLGISGLTFLGCIGYLGYSSLRKKKGK